MNAQVADSQIEAIRAFNRLYTRVLGLLERKLLDTTFSLPYARVMYELASRTNTSAGELSEELSIDPGYLSRMISKLENQKFVKKRRSQEDSRKFLLELTAAGRRAFEKLNAASKDQVEDLLGSLSGDQRAELVNTLSRAHSLLGPKNAQPNQFIFREHRSGDLGYIVHRHGVLYLEEQGFDETFEAYVAEGMAKFVNNFDRTREKLWVVESYGRIVGSIAIAKSSTKTAQLRWLYLEPEVRGQGLGKKLIAEAILFAKSSAYRDIMLWSIDDLKVARKLYEEFGFDLTESKTHRLWGKKLTETKWEMKLR
jgi:DNA-binding MarR family transcriptional regulator/GNAT superfamily N-acetyltransferase